MGAGQGLMLPSLCMSLTRTGGPDEDPEIGPCAEVADGFLIAVAGDRLVLADVCESHVSLLADFLVHEGYVVEEAFLMESKPQVLDTLRREEREWFALVHGCS